MSLCKSLDCPGHLMMSSDLPEDAQTGRRALSAEYLTGKGFRCASSRNHMVLP